MPASDLDLLEQYARLNSEEAFATLVHRHLDLVYSAALRQVRSAQLAEEVAQSVFTDLSRNTQKLKPKTILSAWLYQVTRRTAIDVIRRESRRQFRERIALEMTDMNSTSSAWTQIEPLLDEAMEALDETDRSAVLLRYFENKSLREVGQTLGTSEDAAQKRVGRAVERLREFFAKHGVSLGASGLVVVIAANAVQAAPVGLALTISTAAALSSAAIHNATTIEVTKAIAMTTLQKTLIIATIAVGVGTAIYEARRVSRLQNQVLALDQQHAPLAEQIEQLRQQRDDASSKLVALHQENEQLRRETANVARLRGEVARLRADAQKLAQLRAPDNKGESDPAESAARSWLSRVSLLRQHLEQAPNAKIPEFQFLTEEDWLNVARAKLDTDADYRKAMSALRNAAEHKFGSIVQAALRQYLQANNSQFPAELSQLQPYFESPPGDAVLQRWEIAPAERVPNVRVGGDWIVTQKAAPVDEDYDSRLVFGPFGTGSNPYKSETTTAATNGK